MSVVSKLYASKSEYTLGTTLWSVVVGAFLSPHYCSDGAIMPVQNATARESGKCRPVSPDEPKPIRLNDGIEDEWVPARMELTDQ